MTRIVPSSALVGVTVVLAATLMAQTSKTDQAHASGAAAQQQTKPPPLRKTSGAAPQGPANTSAVTTKSGMAATTPADKAPDLVKITIEPSRTPSMLGTASGVTATIRNVSDIPLLFRERETMFVVPPETRLYSSSNGLLAGCATFVTQGHIPAPKDTKGYEILIPPGESYPVFWDLGTNGCDQTKAAEVSLSDSPRQWFAQKWQRIMFSPGSYKVFLVATFREAGPSADKSAYHTTSESAPVVMAASQPMILIGALIGGILAWLVKTYTQPAPTGAESPKPIHRRTMNALLEIAGAGLLSVSIVILCSRISDTFPIKVNVSDFWGAITLGFIAQLSGIKLLEKLPGLAPNMGSAPKPVLKDNVPAPGDNQQAPAPAK